MSLLTQQYELVSGTRLVLFNYCKTIDDIKLSAPVETFGGRSVIYLLVHVSNTYRFWLGHFTGIKQAELIDESTVDNLHRVIEIYNETDLLVAYFLDHYQASLMEAFSGRVIKYNIELTVTPLQLFTHVVTHEFHHKGQILTMSRLLGYKPVDTDIVRF